MTNRNVHFEFHFPKVILQRYQWKCHREILVPKADVVYSRRQLICLKRVSMRSGKSKIGYRSSSFEIFSIGLVNGRNDPIRSSSIFLFWLKVSDNSLMVVVNFDSCCFKSCRWVFAASLPFSFKT